MAISEVVIEEKLCQFIKEYGEGQYCLLELLRFLGRHPLACFSQLAIVRALDSNKQYVERALRHLINKGVVSVKVEYNEARYILTDDESIRKPVINVAKLDWFQWQLALGQMRPNAKK
jgi:hypothetical protein